MSSFPELAQTLQMTLKALQMYSPAHPRAVSTLQSLAQAVLEWLQDKGYIDYSTEQISAEKRWCLTPFGKDKVK